MYSSYLPAGISPANSFDSFLKSYNKRSPIYIRQLTEHLYGQKYYDEPQRVLFSENAENGWLLQNDTIVVNSSDKREYLRLTLINATSKYFRIYSYGVYYFFFLSQELVGTILCKDSELLNRFGLTQDDLIGMFFYTYGKEKILDVFMISSKKSKLGTSGMFWWDGEYYPNPKIAKNLGRRYILDLLAMYGLRGTELEGIDVFSEEGYAKLLEYCNNNKVNEATQELHTTLVNTTNHKFLTEDDLLEYKVKPYLYAFACQSYHWGISAMTIAIDDSAEDKLYESSLGILMSNPNIMNILTNEEKYLYALGLFNINYHNNNSNSAPINCLWVYILLYELYSKDDCTKYPELIEILSGILCFNGGHFIEFVQKIIKEKFPIKGFWRTNMLSWEAKTCEYALFSIIYYFAGEDPRYELSVEEHQTNRYCIGNLIRSNFRTLYKDQVLERLHHDIDFHNEHESELREFYAKKLYEFIKISIYQHGWYCNRKDF